MCPDELESWEEQIMLSPSFIYVIIVTAFTFLTWWSRQEKSGIRCRNWGPERGPVSPKWFRFREVTGGGRTVSFRGIERDDPGRSMPRRMKSQMTYKFRAFWYNQNLLVCFPLLILLQRASDGAEMSPLNPRSNSNWPTRVESYLTSLQGLNIRTTQHPAMQP